MRANQDKGLKNVMNSSEIQADILVSSIRFLGIFTD